MNYAADGRHFLYSVFGGDIYVAQLDGTGTKRLIERAVKPMYVDGYLVFVRQGTLFAQRFDPVRLELGGNPFPVVEHVQTSDPGIAVAASETGTIDGQQYVVSPDGQRFLVNSAPEETNATPISLILNWKRPVR